MALSVILTDVNGYALNISGAVVGASLAGPLSLAITDANGYLQSVTGATTGPFTAIPSGAVLTDTNGFTVVLPITITDNGTSIVITNTGGAFMEQPVPVVLCDSTGTPLAISGGTIGAFIGGPLKAVLCNAAGAPLTVTIAAGAGGTNGFLLEDGSGVIVLEDGTSILLQEV